MRNCNVIYKPRHNGGAFGTGDVLVRAKVGALSDKPVYVAPVHGGAGVDRNLYSVGLFKKRVFVFDRSIYSADFGCITVKHKDKILADDVFIRKEEAVVGAFYYSDCLAPDDGV